MTITEQLYLNLGPNPEKDKMKVERLRMKLGHKAKQEPNFRFYSLYGHIHRRDILYVAWLKVRANKGGAGIDGVTIGSIDSAEKLDRLLLEIQNELKDGTYRPQPVKRVLIPKSDGKQRPLGIPTIKDRLIQMAAMLILEPIFEEDFLDCSYGFRPKRSAGGALEEINNNIKDGRIAIYDADLKGYFDTIPHDKLIKCLEMRIADNKMLQLIKLWLKCPISEYDNERKKWKQGPPNTKGTPQGGVISPLLANLYLHWFDKVFHQDGGPYKWANARIIRYADDFVIMARYIDDRIIKWVSEKIEEWLGLTVNMEKSSVVNINNGESLHFLGFTYRRVDDLKGRGYKYLEMAPSKKAVIKEKEVIKEMTSSRYNCLPIPVVIDRLNRQVKGWVEYFNKGYPRKSFRHINKFIMDRFAKHLKRRSQRRYRPPEGISVYKHFRDLGLIYL